MPLIVQKYGGTSLGDPDRMRAVAEHVAFTRKHGNDVIVVASAMGKSTDRLITLAGEVSRTRPGREMDMLLTTGERVSAALLTMALTDLGVDAVSFTGSQVGIITDTSHGKAKIVEVKGDRVRQALAEGKVPVVAGFQGVSTAKEITTMGRGASDLTASALAKALGADACEIYTDVTGVFSADPRIVPQARKLARVSFDEMLEMAGVGSKVLALRSVEFARTHGVPLHVRSSFTWEPGTWVMNDASDSDLEAPGGAVLGSDLEAPGGASARIGSSPQTDAIDATGSDLEAPGGASARIGSSLHTDATDTVNESLNVSADVRKAVEGSASDEADAARGQSAAEAKPATENGQSAAEAEPVRRERANHVEDPIISGVVTDVSEAKVTVLGVPDQPGISATLFEPLAAANVNVDMIVQNTSTDGSTDISFTMPVADLGVAEDIVKRIAGEIGAAGVNHDEDIAKVSLVGAGMKSSPGIAARMFRVLADEGINIEMISTSTIRISVVVATGDLERAARSLHTAFGLDSGANYSAPLPERR